MAAILFVLGNMHMSCHYDNLLAFSVNCDLVGIKRNKSTIIQSETAKNLLYFDQDRKLKVQCTSYRCVLSTNLHCECFGHHKSWWKEDFFFYPPANHLASYPKMTQSDIL